MKGNQMRYLVSLIFLSLVSYGYAAEGTLLSCSPNLQEYIQTIENLPESREFIQNLLQEGPIHVGTSSNHLAQQFGAFWESQSRRVCVHPSWHHSKAQLIASIMFELHNAAATKQIDYYYTLAERGEIGKQQFVEAIESIEYNNSVRAAKLLQTGVEQKIYPQGTSLYVYPTFQEYLRCQKIGGHSQAIASAFDEISPHSFSTHYYACKKCGGSRNKT